ncbi:hypothetical protein M758_3G023800 [Ceratodon purpureus]|nr:hypothetical protein M758_3G023800 [Ceratodon purpureus]
MRALPDTDGRSLKNQAKLHCAYCDNNFYFSGNEHPLEIHQSWLFLPWHRMFVYFHERILAHLLEDDTFALPFWFWDDTSAESDSGNRLPKLYAEQSVYGGNGNTSSLYDGDRNACAQRPNIVDLVDPFVGCVANKSDAVLRRENAHLMYTHMVTGAVTPSLFFGQPYRFGDKGGVGGGTLEVKPHGPVHLWVNIVKMLTNKLSASDPIFFAHHANVDRLWTVWKTLPGGIRKDIADPDWLHTEFTYYNEHGKLVVASIGQSLDITNLRYDYAEVATPWITGAVDANESTITTSSWPFCNTASPSNLTTMFETTEPFRSGLSLFAEPVSFKVRRKAESGAWSRGDSEEVLQVRGTMNWTLPMSFNAFVNFPEAVVANGSLQGCREYVGSFVASPHEGSSPEIPGRLHWRVALQHKLRDLGAEAFGELVVTLVPALSPNQTIALTSAKILYIRS